MALPRRVLPSRVPLPADAPASVAAPGVTPAASSPAAPPTRETPAAVVAATASADLTALGALLAEGLPSTPSSTPSAAVVAAPIAAIAPAPAPQPMPDPLPAPVSVAETAVAVAPSAPKVPEAEASASRPDDNNPLRRRPRQPRAFTFTPAPEETPPAPVINKEEAPTTNPEKLSAVADTTPLAEVDDRLQAAGIIPTPVADNLTAMLPPSVASVPTPAEKPAEKFVAPLPPVELPAELPAPVAQAVAAPPPAPLPLPPAAPSTLPVALAIPSEQPIAVPVVAPVIAAAPVMLTMDPPAPVPPPSTSSLPWAMPLASSTPAAPEGSSWNQWGNLPPTTEATVAAPPTPQPTPDVYGSNAYGFHGGPQVGPLASGAGNGQLPPPLLPDQFSHNGKGGKSGGGKGSNWQLGLAAAVVVAALFGAYQLVSRKEASPAQLALQTPSASNATNAPALMPPPAPGSNGAPASNLFAGTPGISGTTITSDSNAQISFSDVPPDQAGKPIVADGSEKMPSDVGFVAQLQSAIATEQAKKAGQPGSTLSTAAATATKTDTKADMTASNDNLKAQLATELAAYRKALANTPPGEPAPKPSEFMGKAGAAGGVSASAVADATPVPSANGDLLPPPQLSANGQGGGLLPPSELYKNNPKGLPVVPEPTAAAQPKVRQLTDFDVSMFATPEHDRVRIPSGIKPRFSTTDFPQMDVLSFVPGKGLIAYHDGKEGVLLIGESIDGWELNHVNADNAEFKNGQRSQYVTAE